MFNVCRDCGLYRADKTIDPTGPYALCPECGHAHPFRRLPLLLVGGASGAGKSTILQHLLGRVESAILLEADILWRPEFNRPDDGYRDFFETWLRLAKNIGQAGRPVTLFGAGMAVPENIEPRVERRYFGAVSYLALVCDEDVLAARLRARPAWRESRGAAFVQEQIHFNRWCREQGPAQSPPVAVLDTTAADPAATADAVKKWIEAGAVDAPPWR